MKNRAPHLGQDGRGGVVVEIDHQEHSSPCLRRSKVRSLKSNAKSPDHPLSKWAGSAPGQHRCRTVCPAHCDTANSPWK
jgi:hypothetical protein